MPRRTDHEMDEWPDIRRPWYVRFWRVVYIWMAVVVLIIIVVPIWRSMELRGAKAVDCEGIVKSIRTEQPVPGAGNKPLVFATIQVRGKFLEVPVDTKMYPDLRIGDKIALTCRVGRGGSLFVQKWRPAETVSSEQ